MKLYEIADAYREIDAQIDEAEGEVTPEIWAALSYLNDRLSDKVDAIGALIREATAEHDAFTTEANRLRSRAMVAQRKAERLKTYLLASLEALNLRRAGGLRFSARIATASTPTITWEGQGDPPEDYRRVKIELDGKAAHEAFKAGALPTGFKVVRTEYLDLR